jgi:glycolate oxidase FAD binding subunit
MQHDLKTDIPFALAMRFLAEAETIESQFRMVSELTRDTDVSQSLPDQDAGEAFWSRYASTVLLPEWSYILRIGALPSQISQVVDEIERLAPGGSIFCHAANGVVRVHATSDWLSRLKTAQRPRRISELRQLAQQRGGSLIIERAPDEIRTMLDVWGEAGMNARLMREVKAKFDPLSLLNPGRFVAGI